MTDINEESVKQLADDGMYIQLKDMVAKKFSPPEIIKELTEWDIDADDKPKPVPTRESKRAKFIERYITKDESSQIKIDGEIFHQNYLYYLRECWANHYKVIVDPVILWHIVLGEIARDVKSHAEEYREFFTTQPPEKGKTNISIPTMDVDYFVDEIIRNLNDLIPSPLSDEILIPDFSTHTDMSRFTYKIAFMDMASPYYSYSMYLCNIEEVKVLGTTEDWYKFNDGLLELILILKIERLQKYLKRVSQVISDIYTHRNDQEWLTRIFILEECGSGHQELIGGWITRFYLLETQDSAPYIDAFNTLCSSAEFTILGTPERKGHIYAGLFSSTLNIDETSDLFGYLVPEFGSVVTLKTVDT